MKKMKDPRATSLVNLHARDALRASRRGTLALRSESKAFIDASLRGDDILGTLRILGLIILRPGGWLPI